MTRLSVPTSGAVRRVGLPESAIGAHAVAEAEAATQAIRALIGPRAHRHGGGAVRARSCRSPRAAGPRSAVWWRRGPGERQRRHRGRRADRRRRIRVRFACIPHVAGRRDLRERPVIRCVVSTRPTSYAERDAATRGRHPPRTRLLEAPLTSGRARRTADTPPQCGVDVRRGTALGVDPTPAPATTLQGCARPGGGSPAASWLSSRWPTRGSSSRSGRRGPATGDREGVPGALAEAARLSGLLGAYLVLVELLLLARLPVLDRLAGFDRLTVWHRRLGTRVRASCCSATRS